MRASRARSVDLHAGGVVGARAVFHSAPIAFGMSQGCLCRMELRLVLGCFANALDEGTKACIHMFNMQCGMYSHVQNAMWHVFACSKCNVGCVGSFS